MANTVPKESKVVYLQIGQNYEHLANTKQFDVSEWVEAYPGATIYMLFRRPGEDVVAPVQTTLEDGILTWTISNWETGIIGVGFAEIRAIDSTTGLVKKSHVIPCSVEASVTDEDTAPDFPSWIDRMITMNEHLESVYADFNQELADGIAAIQDEAAEKKEGAIAAIQDKGDAVIASIPMSYTDLIEALAGAAYNANRHYAHDEFVWYDNHLWRRRTDSPSIVGPWNEDDWIRAALTAHVTEALWQVESMQREIYNSIAPAWNYYDTTASYAVGDYVINREKLYRCISPVSGGGDFDYNKWEVVTVAAELQRYVKSGAIASDYSASATYKAGQYVWYSGNVYRCKTDISTAEAWTAAHWQLVKIGDELTDLKSALAHTEDVVGNRYYILHGCAMNSGGQIIDSPNFDTFCFKVTDGELLTVTGIFDGYAFYVDEPQVGSVSYNSGATFTTSLVDVETPAGCSWAAVRCSAGNFLERNNTIDKLNEETANIEEALTQSLNRVGGDSATGVFHLPATWINGAFNPDGSFENAQQRATTRDWMKYTSSVTITCDSSYRMRVIGDGVYVSDWLTGDFTIPSNTKFKINIRSNPDSTGTINPIEFGEKIYIKNPLNGIISPIKSQFDNLYSNFPFSNAELNKYIKELYTESNTDFSGVTRVRVYNGFYGLYGAKFYTSGNVQIADLTFDSYPSGVVCKNQLYAVIVNLSDLGAEWKDFSTTVNDCVRFVDCMPTIYAYVKYMTAYKSSPSSCTPAKGQIIYAGDSKSNDNYIVNAVAYSDGVIIACRANGTVVRIGYDNAEETILTIPGTGPFDWRGCYIDSNENVFVSPHASYGSFDKSYRGLYKLTKGGNAFIKVLSLYNSSSSVQTETEDNDDTIWTMCEDNVGNLYAGVYAHTKRANPAIYKSTDGGDTWEYIYNFKTSGDAPNGLHIHTIVWSEWQKALYVIVGEVNTIFKSVNGGETWTDLHVTLTVKGSSMLATENGLLIGSDGAYNCDIDILYNDDKTHEKVFRGWANTVFAIRRSDVTGIVYAFTKIDSSVNSTSYFPPVSALTDPSAIDTWHNSVGDSVFNSWKAYHDSVITEYSDDAVRPQHYAILVSRNGGKHWNVLKAFSCSSQQANGCWTTGYFANGECLTGRMENSSAINPVVISEGKHKYVSGGCDLNGEIFVRTNSSSTVTIID